MDYEVSIAESRTDLEAAFAIRMIVFVEEQCVPVEEEMDAYDAAATHFVVRAPNESGVATIAGTARLVLRSEDTGKIGRVAVLAGFRGFGLGAALMLGIHDYALHQGLNYLELEAQCYAIPFYEKLGYVADGPVFLDANIEHRHMSMTLSDSNGNSQTAASPKLSTDTEAC